LVKDDKAAKAVLARLKKGEKFEKLAETLSQDSGTKSKGGELGWVRADAQLVKPFLDAMVKLKKGETSEPVKTDFGFHIIRVDDVRKAQAPSIDQVRGELTQFMQRRAIEKMVQDLRSKATID
jgi:peptidyl-prolyl cis-trans isomerase C